MIEFTVLGLAQPAGSKKAFAMPNGRGGYTARVVDANSKSKPWQAEVKAAARAAYDGELLTGAIGLTLTFYRPRPQSHFGTGRNAGTVKASAPDYPITRPDALKLARGVEDALTGIIWKDDSQITDEHLHKRYGEPARCEVRITQIAATTAITKQAIEQA